MTLDIYLARHGATEWSRNGRHTGVTDLDLLPEGEEEARRLLPRLRAAGVRSAFTSDRSRARRSAALAGFPAAITTPLLREFDYGEYEGLTTQQIQTTRPDWEIYHDGCPGGESPDQVYTRAKAALQLAAGAPAPVVLFSHGHFLRALAVAWTDLHIQAAARLALDTGTLCLLRDGDHGRVLQTWNVPD